MRTPDIRHAALIVRTEARRSVRSFAGRRARAAILLVSMAVLGLMQLAAVVAVYFLARGGVDATAVRWVRLAAAGVWTLFVALTAITTISNRSAFDGMDGLLTTVAFEDATVAILCVNGGRSVVSFGLALVLAPFAFGLALGSPAAVGTALLAVACLLVSAVLVGGVVGFGVKNLTVRSAFVARYRTAIVLLAFLAYYALIATQTGGSVAGAVARAVAATPVAWLADLALLPVAAVSPLAALGALCGALVVSTAALYAAFPLTEALWYADRAEPTERDRATAEATTLSPGPFARVDAGPAGWVAYTAALRARRAPVKLLYVAYPLFGLTAPISDAVRTGVVSPLLVAYVAIYAAWAAGAGFALNPLGDEGAALPVSATSGATGREFVRGHVLVTAAVGVPVGVVATAAIGALSPLGPVPVVTLAVASACVCVGAGGIAAGVGSALPRYEGVRVTRSRRATVPSLLAFVGYSAALLLAAAPAVLSAVPATARVVAGVIGVRPTALLVAGTALSVALVWFGGYVGYRAAADRFDAYSV